MIETKLNGLSSFQLKFKHEKCKKCGSVGDSRYVVAACHTKMEYLHIRPLSKRHTGQRTAVHTGRLIRMQGVIGRRGHTGQRISDHSGVPAVPYHPGNLRESTVKRLGTFVVTLSISEFVWKPREWQWWDCCNRPIRDGELGCVVKWSCCGENKENEECYCFFIYAPGCCKLFAFAF